MRIATSGTRRDGRRLGTPSSSTAARVICWRRRPRVRGPSVYVGKRRRAPLARQPLGDRRPSSQSSTTCGRSHRVPGASTPAAHDHPRARRAPASASWSTPHGIPEEATDWMFGQPAIGRQPLRRAREGDRLHMLARSGSRRWRGVERHDRESSYGRSPYPRGLGTPARASRRGEGSGLVRTLSSSSRAPTGGHARPAHGRVRAARPPGAEVEIVRPTAAGSPPSTAPGSWSATRSSTSTATAATSPVLPRPRGRADPHAGAFGSRRAIEGLTGVWLDPPRRSPRSASISPAG